MYDVVSLNPRLEKVSDSIFEYGTRTSQSFEFRSITANGTPLIDFLRDTIYFGNVKFLGMNAQLHRGFDTRYYILHKKNGGMETYIDGSLTTDYPDFKIYPLGVSDVLKAYGGLKPFLQGSVECGPSISGALIVDRYGYKYIAVTPSYGIGFSFASYGEGYVSNGQGSKILDSQILQKNILGSGFGATLSLGAGSSVSTGWNFWENNSPRTIVYSAGIQIGASFDTFIVFPYPFSPNPDASLGWQWALDMESPGSRGNAYFRSDF